MNDPYAGTVEDLTETEPKIRTLPDEPEGEAPVDANDPAPRIIVEFAGPGMADLNIRAEGPVEPAQIYAAAWLFDRWAHELRDGMIAQAVAKAQQRQELISRTALDITGRGRSFRG